MVRQAAGLVTPVTGKLFTRRQSSCTSPVTSRVANAGSRMGVVPETGICQSRAAHSFTSPAPIPPLLKARNRRTINTQISLCPGKCKIRPDTISGQVNQLGMRRVHRSYSETASAAARSRGQGMPVMVQFARPGRSKKCR